MKILIAHSTKIDYQNDIYVPLKSDAFLSEYELILPHENSSEIVNTREDYKNIDIVIAECSEPSIGVGIELGWCYDEDIPIYIFHKNGSSLSDSARTVANRVIQYEDRVDFVEKVKGVLINLAQNV